MWYKNDFFKITTGIILILLIVLLLIQIRGIFDLAIEVISSIVFPVVTAFIIYYILRPFRNFLENKKFPRALSVTVIFLIFIFLLAVVITIVGPQIQQQIVEFSTIPEQKLKFVETKTIEFMNIFNFNEYSPDQLRDIMIVYLQKAFKYVTADISATLGSIARVASFFIITPFILFYLLKDDHTMALEMQKTIPKIYYKDTKSIINDIDGVLAGYISCQLIVAAIVGVLIFIGYYSIGLHYAFLLAMIAFVFNMIPFFGPFISTIPALLIGLSISPGMCFKVILIVLLVHLLDLNLISPRIVGPRLKIHPITIIFLLVASASVFGFFGLFVAVPFYAILKVIVKGVHETIENKIADSKSG